MEEPDVPEEDKEALFAELLPSDLDLHSLSKSDLWFDTSSYKKSRSTPLEEYGKLASASSLKTGKSLIYKIIQHIN